MAIFVKKDARSQKVYFGCYKYRFFVTYTYGDNESQRSLTVLFKRYEMDFDFNSYYDDFQNYEKASEYYKSLGYFSVVPKEQFSSEKRVEVDVSSPSSQPQSVPTEQEMSSVSQTRYVQKEQNNFIVVSSFPSQRAFVPTEQGTVLESVFSEQSISALPPHVSSGTEVPSQSADVPTEHRGDSTHVPVVFKKQKTVQEIFDAQTSDAEFIDRNRYNLYMADALPSEATPASPYVIPKDEGELELPVFPEDQEIDPDLISSQKYDVPKEQKVSNFEPEQVAVPFVSPSVSP
jgi:hypothetical protein